MGQSLCGNWQWLFYPDTGFSFWSANMCSTSVPHVLQVVIALGLHSTLDGLALALGKETELLGGMDASLLLAICIHKIPEGLALGALLLASGLTRFKALTWVAAVESTTLLGGALGLWVMPHVSGLWMDLVLAHVGGGFLFLAFHAVFGELVKHGKSIVLVSFSAGILLILALNLVVSFL
jgi:zinc transporter ZupT